MAASSSSFIPTPLAHADNQGEREREGCPYIDAQQKLIYMTPRSSPGEDHRLVSDIRVSVSAEYCHRLCAVKSTALSKTLPAIRNKKDLEIKFYVSQQRSDQEPTDYVYDLLKLQKKN
ncbi:uncharacterized protein TNCV_662161 [Trichonephila clavipes]|nr:uncharacterized protein TNCV_662161 [Trichonephila clavipes]